MTLVSQVWNLSDDIMKEAKYVSIIYKYPGIRSGCIKDTAKLLKDWLQREENKPEKTWPIPEVLQTDREVILYELIANSVNYCYWYGSSNIRPNGSSSTKMYELLNKAFEDLNGRRKKWQSIINRTSVQLVKSVIELAIQNNIHFNTDNYHCFSNFDCC